MSLNEEGMKNSSGFSIFNQQVFYVNISDSPEYVKETFWHELTHFFLEPMTGSWTDSNTTSFDMETTCNLVSQGLQEVLQQIEDWPDFLKPPYPKI